MDSANINARRKVLHVVVASILNESGFDTVDKDALDTITEMLQCFLTELGNTTRSFCEHAGRTEPIIGDVMVSLCDMGINWKGIEAYSRRDNRHVVPAPQQATVQKQLNILQAGTKSAHPAHIPNHLPPLPDPHAYIRTPTHKQPVTEYEAIREKSANQKRDIEKALTKFLAKTSGTHSLFDSDDNGMFPLIACKPVFPTYLAPLMPTDQVFDFEELEYHYQVANRTEDLPDTKKEDGENEDESDLNSSNTKTENNNSSQEVNSQQSQNSATIDNPYLQAAKVPHKVKTDI